jgi:hypothetical protein
MAKNPTPAEIRQSFIDHGVDASFYSGWDTKGNAWTNGLQAVVVHHTANPNSGKLGNFKNILYWCVNAYAPYAVANQLVGKNAGENMILCGRGTYHSGLGGPWSAVGVGVGNVLHWRAWGIEIDDPGVSNTINSYQIEQVARTIAALWDLCEWPDDGSRIITHGDWTDSGPYLKETNYGPYRYRKNDTLRQFYDQNFWRKEASKYRLGVETWDGTIPTRRAATKAANEKINNKAAWRCVCRLYDLGFRKHKPKGFGGQPYPKTAMIAFQKSIGLTGENASGMPNKITWIKLFGKDKP